MYVGFLPFKTERFNIRFCYNAPILCYIVFYISISYKFGTAIAFKYYN